MAYLDRATIKLLNSDSGIYIGIDLEESGCLENKIIVKKLVFPKLDGPFPSYYFFDMMGLKTVVSNSYLCDAITKPDGCSMYSTYRSINVGTSDIIRYWIVDTEEDAPLYVNWQWMSKELKKVLFKYQTRG